MPLMRASRLAIGGPALVGSALLAVGAAAQPEPPPPAPVGAHGGVAELGVNFGFVDAFGDVSTQTPAHQRTAGFGGTIELDAGWRLSAPLALGVFGFGTQLSQTPAAPWSADVYEAGAGVAATWHIRPSATDYDPWIAIGSGWRAQWLAYLSDSTTTQHGVEMLRARVGVDLRASPSVALSPVLGASLSTFLVEEVQGGAWRAISSPAVNTFVFAGVRATVDL